MYSNYNSNMCFNYNNDNRIEDPNGIHHVLAADDQRRN